MLFFPKAQPSNVLSHWYVVLDGFSHSSQEFYQAVERELDARKVPGLKRSRVDFREGGGLSDQRAYLRLARERYAFDVCAAPFGRTYFFSLRLVEVPRPVLWPLLLVLALFLIGLYLLVTKPALLLWVLIALLFHRVWLPPLLKFLSGPPPEGAPPAAGPPDLDTLLLHLPVIGPWYEARRKDTYFRQDTRLCYQTIVSDIVKAEVDRVTAAKGIKLIRTHDYNPLLDLYRTTEQPPVAGGRTDAA
jgi:hypothetical protein